jgi:uncharacterized protein (TIGR03437 family)
VLLVALGLSAAEPSYTIRTIAGTNFAGDNGKALSAFLTQPEGMATDTAGNLYIADAANHRVRKVDSQGNITTVAGIGLPGFEGDGGAAAQAHLNSPYDVCVDRLGNVYIADLGNGRVRRIGNDGKITTVAGGGTIVPDAITSYNSAVNPLKLDQPRNLALDSRGSLYISDFSAHRVYKLTADGFFSTFAGTGTSGYSGDKGTAVRAELSHPTGIVLDGVDSLYIADSDNHRVRRVAGGIIDTLVDVEGKPFEFGTPTSITTDRLSRLYVADGGNPITWVSLTGEAGTLPSSASAVHFDLATGRLFYSLGRKVSVWQYEMESAYAGTTSINYAGDGAPPSEWRFETPAGIASDKQGNLYVADSRAGRVRRISASGVLSTIVVGLNVPTGLTVDNTGKLWISDAKSNELLRWDGVTSAATLVSSGSPGKPFKEPSGIVSDANGNIFVADTGNNLIRKLAPDGSVTTVAGGGGLDEDTQGVRMRLLQPWGLAFDKYGNLWFTEAGAPRLRKLTPTGYIYTLKNVELREARALRIGDDECFYVVDSGNQRILKVTQEGSWWPIAGSGSVGFKGDLGPALEASLSNPLDLIFTSKGNIVFTDTGNQRIRELLQVGDGGSGPGGPQGPLHIEHTGTKAAGPLAPAQIAVLTAEGYNAATQAKVLFAGRVATILSVKDKQIFVQVPANLAAGTSPVVLSWLNSAGTTVSASGEVEIRPVAPGILGIYNQTGTMNSSQEPADRGSDIVVYVTGEGLASAPAVSAQIGSYMCEIVYVGRSLSMPGVLQVNLRTPSGFAPPGQQEFALYIEGEKVPGTITVTTR